MKRPLAVIGITFLATLILIGTSDGPYATVLLIASAVLFILSISIKSVKKAAVIPSVCLAVAAACILFIMQTQFEYNPAVEMADREVSLEGTVTDVLGKNKNGSYRYIIKTDKIQGQQREVNIRLSSKTLPDADYYDRVKINNATLYKLGEQSENAHLYFKSSRVYIGAYTYEEIEPISPDDKPFMYRIVKIRHYIKDTVTDKLPGEEGAVLIGMLIGDSSEMGRDTYDNFKKSGVSHLFAVSGLHLSIFAMFVFNILSATRLGKGKAAFISGVFTLFFMALAGFTPSVMRAGIMTIVYFIGQAARRDTDSLTSLGLAAILVTFLNPFSAVSAGLMLSFSATLGIIVLSKPLSEPIKRRLGKWKSKRFAGVLGAIAEMAAITISASLFTLPVMMLRFGGMSSVSVITNLLTVNAGGSAMLLSGTAVIVSALPIISGVSMPLFFISGILAKYVLWCTQRLAQLSFSYIAFNYDYMVNWMIGAFILLLAAVIFKGERKRNIRLASILSVIILLAAVLSNTWLNRNITKINVVHTGNGTGVVLTREGRGIVIGCGGEYYTASNVDNVLFSNSVSQIDLMIIPRTQETESSAAQDILDLYTVNELLYQEEDEVLEASVKVWGDVTIYCKTDLNSSFACVKIKEFTILITFYPSTDIRAIPKEFLNADILICRAGPPQGLSCGSFGIIVVSDEQNKAVRTAYAIKSKGGNAAVIEKDVIEMRTRGNPEFSLRGNLL
ncbi:MAG: ComEC/Rec2 family competence protein [Oscillospiraceae bacterium]|nr:ComEC/Rec2 family competence protein [Oscillospiraceae bacterium]